MLLFNRILESEIMFVNEYKCNEPCCFEKVTRRLVFFNEVGYFCEHHAKLFMAEMKKNSIFVYPHEFNLKNKSGV